MGVKLGLWLTLNGEEWESCGKSIPSPTVGAGRASNYVAGAKNEMAAAGLAHDTPTCADHPNQPDRQHQATDHGSIEAVLRRRLVGRKLTDFLLVYQLITEHDCDKSKETTDHNRKKDKTTLLDIEPIYRGECIRHCCEEAEQGAEPKSSIETDESDNWFEDQHSTGSEDSDKGKFPETH
ncbi:unnamed protein product [Clonostachys chloroleuca]|uniref:Uncharacterized protein n=1 Tax=Clonostachys chloroleuca TaxID=1926264 RepID=A0AA35PUB8_9HYPO|nr:unnamed protein product [Clonostachys chloroleuca]